MLSVLNEQNEFLETRKTRRELGLTVGSAMLYYVYIDVYINIQSDKNAGKYHSPNAQQRWLAAEAGGWRPVASGWQPTADGWRPAAGSRQPAAGGWAVQILPP